MSSDEDVGPVDSALLRSIYRNHLRGRLQGLVESTLSERVVTRTALRSSGECHEFGSAERFECREPPHRGRLPPEIRAKFGPVTVPRPFVCELSGVTLVGPWALPVDAEGGYVLEGTDGSLDRLTDTLVATVVAGHVPARVGRNPDSTSVSGPLVSLVGQWGEEYFHWFADYLTRLEGVERYAEQTGTAPDVLVPANPPAWLTDSLTLAGVEPDRWVEWDGSRLLVDTLVVPSIRRHTYETDHSWGYVHSPAAVRWLADRIVDNAGVDREDAGRRIYVSREGARERHVVNEAEVVDALSAHGFEKCRPTELSFAEQVSLFASAETVVGPHGGGLTNAIYASDPTLVELFGSYVNPCYFALAEGLGAEYGFVRCEDRRGDLLVDVDELVDLIETLL